MISEINEFKEKWLASQVLAPERLAALRQVVTIESVGSSTRIEGVGRGSRYRNGIRGLADLI